MDKRLFLTFIQLRVLPTVKKQQLLATSESCLCIHACVVTTTWTSLYFWWHGLLQVIKPGDQRSERILHDAGGSQSATLADALSFSELSRCGFRVETTSHANFPSLSLAVSRDCLGAAQRADPTLRQCFSNVVSADKARVEKVSYSLFYFITNVQYIRKKGKQEWVEFVCVCRVWHFLL